MYQLRDPYSPTRPRRRADLADEYGPDDYDQEYAQEDEHEAGLQFEGGFVARTLEALGGGLWQVAIRAAILGGERNENKLTNMVFFARHPDRGGRPLDPSEPRFDALSAEWLDIRDRLVRPALRAAQQRPAPPPSGGVPAGAPWPAVNTPLPASGPGFYSQQPVNRRYGLPETIQALETVGARWHNLHPTGPRIEIRDISKPGGGPFSPHKSHQVGLDVDIRILRKDGREKTRVCYRDAAYSRPLTQQLADLIRDNGVLKVKAIGFCDPQVRGVTCQGYAGHNCHMHVRFCLPSHYQFLPSSERRYSGCR